MSDTELLDNELPDSRSNNELSSEKLISINNNWSMELSITYRRTELIFDYINDILMDYQIDVHDLRVSLICDDYILNNALVKANVDKFAKLFTTSEYNNLNTADTITECILIITSWNKSDNLIIQTAPEVIIAYGKNLDEINDNIDKSTISMYNIINYCLLWDFAIIIYNKK